MSTAFLNYEEFGIIHVYLAKRVTTKYCRHGRSEEYCIGQHRVGNAVQDDADQEAKVAVSAAQVEESASVMEGTTEMI